MFFKSFLYSTLLCSVAIGAEPFDPNNLTGKACDQRRQLIEYLDQNGVEHIKSDSLTILKFLATSYINSQASNGDTQVLRDQLDTLAEEKDRLQTKADRRKQKKQAIAAEKLSLEQHLSVITAQLQAAEADLSALRSQENQSTQALEHKITTLTEERNRLKDEVDSLKEKVLGDQQLEEIVSRFTTYEKQISDLRADLEHRQELSEKLEDSYRETLNSKAQELSDLEQRHQGDLLLIAQLQEQVRLLQEAQQTSASSSAPLAQQNGTIPPAPSTPPKTESKSFKRGTRIPTPMPPAGRASAAPSASQLTGARLKSQSEQTPLAEQKAPELVGHDALMEGIRSRTKTTLSLLTIDQKLKVEGIKADIESGKFVSAFWAPKQQAKESEDLAKSINMTDLLIKAMYSIRKNTEDSDSDGSENDDWLDDDSSVAAASSSDTQQISPELLHNLSTIRQIYRDALNIGYEDAEKTIKWSMDKWLLWENDNYKTDRQRAKLDAVIMQYIKDNIDKLTTLYEKVDFNSVVQQNGTPVAKDSQDSLALSVVMK